MDKETKDIIKLIAGIQIESLNSIKERYLMAITLPMT